jgi:precorrin-6Y C5,15-methyltransferase (decarboxylating)
VKVAMASGDVRSTGGHLPQPDAVFLGPGLAGPGGPDAVRACAALRPSRLVAIVAAGTARETLDVLADHGFAADAVQLSAAPLGAEPEPSEAVIVVWGERDVPDAGRRTSRTIRPIETTPGLPGDIDEPAG